MRMAETGVRTNLLHAAWVLPSVTLQPHPTPHARLCPRRGGRSGFQGARRHYGHQASKVFAESNDKLLINNELLRNCLFKSA